MKTHEEYYERIRKKTRLIITVSFVVLLFTLGTLWTKWIFEPKIHTETTETIYKITRPEKTLPKRHSQEVEETSEHEQPTKESEERRVQTDVIDPTGIETHFTENSRDTAREKLPTPSADVQNTDHDAAKAKSESDRAAWKEWNAEIDRALAESVEIQAEAKAAIAAAIPPILEHLNTLSPEEQREFLTETKKQMIRMSPPEIQDRVMENPELAEQGWKLFLQLLVEQGYRHPR